MQPLPGFTLKCMLELLVYHFQGGSATGASFTQTQSGTTSGLFLVVAQSAPETGAQGARVHRGFSAAASGVARGHRRDRASFRSRPGRVFSLRDPRPLRTTGRPGAACRFAQQSAVDPLQQDRHPHSDPRSQDVASGIRGMAGIHPSPPRRLEPSSRDPRIAGRGSRVRLAWSRWPHRHAPRMPRRVGQHPPERRTFRPSAGRPDPTFSARGPHRSSRSAFRPESVQRTHRPGNPRRPPRKRRPDPQMGRRHHQDFYHAPHSARALRSAAIVDHGPSSRNRISRGDFAPAQRG